MSHPPASLLRHPDFLNLWIGQTVSLFGSQITFLALPLAAAVTLRATPAEMGFLLAASTSPALVFGLLAGAWADRTRRRPLMLGADLARAALLATIPAAAALGVLTLPHLCAVAFATGALALLFDAAYAAYLPALVPREQLVDANSKLATSVSLAQIGGPALAGLLVTWLTAPIVIAADALSFLVSALSLRLIRTREAAPSPQAEDPSLVHALRAGVRVIAGHALLRPIAAASATLNFFGGMIDALLILYLTRDLAQPQLFVGSVYALGSFSGLLGALAGARIAARLGLGRTILAGALLTGVGWACLAWAVAVPPYAVAIVLAGALLFGLGNATYNLAITSQAQLAVPAELLGRYYATMTVAATALLPVGSLLGGALGTLLGVRSAMALAGAGMLTAFVWVLASPLRYREAARP